MAAASNMCVSLVLKVITVGLKQMYTCGWHLSGMPFIMETYSFAFMNVCLTPIPMRLWCDHFQTSSAVELVLVPDWGPMSPLFFPFKPFSISHPLPVSPLPFFPYPVPPCDFLLHSLYLFRPLFSYSRGSPPPSSPGRSWSFLTAHGNVCVFSPLLLFKLVSLIPYRSRPM